VDREGGGLVLGFEVQLAELVRHLGAVPVSGGAHVLSLVEEVYGLVVYHVKHVSCLFVPFLDLSLVLML
jgi:hypothetical protein